MVESAHAQHSVADRDEHFWIDLGRTVLRSSHIVVALLAVDHHFQNTPHLGGFYLRAHLLLHGHQLVEAALLRFGGNVVLVVIRCECALLFRIGKGTHPLKLSPAHEVHQFDEVGLGLAREAHHQRGTEGNAWHAASDFRY